jgi:soluble lytic murein transglycosylase
MISNTRGVARLLVFLIAAATLMLLLPTSYREHPVVGPAPPSDVSAPTPSPAPAPQALIRPSNGWRAKLGSLQEVLHNFLHRKNAEPQQAKRNDFAFFGDVDESALSLLLTYAPPADSWLNETYPPDPPPLEAAILLGDDRDGFMRALASYKAGSFAAGDFAAASIKSSVAVTAAQWAGLRLHPREAGLSRLVRFLESHPSWPAAEWVKKRIEEALFGDKHPDKIVKAYFAQSKPSTTAGKLALARVHIHDGDLASAGALVVDVWRDDDLNDSLEGFVKKEYGVFLTAADHKWRADRLLYQEKHGGALRAAALAGKDVSLLARARIAANAEVANEKVFSTVPANLQNDPGLLFARIHTLRLSNKIAEAGALMKKAPREADKVIDGDAWWTERRLLSRKLLDKGDAESAYAICAEHLARATSSKVEAEFHAGWIALRFLNDPVRAKRHFETLSQIAETPAQKSRAAYWLGRTAEFSGQPEDQEKARAFYQSASQHSTSFYGQLARSRLGVTDSPLRLPPTPAEGDQRDEAVRAVELLFAVGDRETATSLSYDSARKLDGESQLAALAIVASRQRDAKI